MTDSPLLKMLSQKALPWAGQWDVPRFIVARSSLRALLAAHQLPDGVATTRNKPGHSIAVRGPHDSSKRASFVLRRWPQAGLESKRVPLLACTVQGQADLRLGDYILHCPEGHFVLQPPGVPHYDGSCSHLEGARREDGFCQVLTIAPLNESTLRCWMCRSSGEKHRTLINYYIHDRQAIMYLKAISDEGRAQRSGYERVCRGLLVALLSVVQREISEGRYVQWVSPESRPQDRLPTGDPVAAAQQYIKAHLSESLPMERVAHEVFLSRSLFAKRFRAGTGKTFTEYLTECRLAQAEMLLRETDWSMLEVGRAVGLKPTRLQEIFHRHAGLPPSQFRVHIRRKENVDDSGSD